jgi:hypothetical protein
MRHEAFVRTDLLLNDFLLCLSGKASVVFVDVKHRKILQQFPVANTLEVLEEIHDFNELPNAADERVLHWCGGVEVPISAMVAG